MAALRNIITGAVHTEQRRFKANCASTPQCPWCESQDDETIEHLFWVCPKWQHLRQPLMNEYANVLALLPPCMRECGLFPQRLLGTDPFTVPYELVPKTQTMMISILRERAKFSKTDSPTSRKSLCKAAPVEISDSQLPIASNRESLFPNYPWTYDRQRQFSVHCFKGVVPSNWRTYKKGSAWLFGLDTFAPLHWYWRNPKWPDQPGAEDEISWLELALDFRAATHCSLAMPGSSQSSSNAAQMAHLSSAASRRMAKICHGTLSPGPQITHTSILTSIGLGRCSGFSVRPQLMCPDFVHSCLFQTLCENQCHIDQNFKFVPLLPPVPKVLWTTEVAKVRLTGKQNPPEHVPSPSQKRVVKSYKNTVAGVEWTREETRQIASASDWREKQQFQKILLHNRNATNINKHVISLGRVNSKFVCSICQRSNVNLSRLLLDTCGGSSETNRGTHVPRSSVMLQKRQQLVNNRNAQSTHHHVFGVPENADSPVACTRCGAQDPEGWRRFARFAKMTCPLAK